MTNKHFLLIILSFLLFIINIYPQGILESSKISGNVQIDAQYYQKDSIIGAEDVEEKVLSNAFFFLNFTNGPFSANVRYESYVNPLLGIESKYKGNGIAFRNAEYNTEFISVTAGNFYEQFGNGLVLRTYEDRQLGYDNSIDGLRAKIRPLKGIEFTGLIGKQRYFWDLGSGIVRGADVNLSIGDIFENLLSNKQLTIGASIVSKYQEDFESFYNLPANVFAYSTRAAFTAGVYQLSAEFAYKINDPTVINHYNYNHGTGLIFNASYFPEGFGISLNLHRYDNMEFRSDRTEQGNSLYINYLPSLTKQQAYRLATVYPYATQPNNEVGIQTEITYTFPKKSMFGGKYGTTINFNFSRVHSLDTTQKITTTIFRDTTTSDSVVYKDVSTYDSPFFAIGERLFFNEFNFEIVKKWSSELKTNLTIINSIYDKDIVENQGSPKYGKVNSTAVIGEISYKLNPTTALRLELQHLWATQDSIPTEDDNVNGNWGMALVELTLAPSWYISLSDEYNYGNENTDKQLHYLNANLAYVTGPTRISLGYGRQRGGVLCIGGVCRQVPASNGLLLSITSTF